MSAPTFVASAEPGRVVLHGDIDAFDIDDLLVVLAGASDDHRRDLLLDLSEVTFLPSLVIGALARARADATRNGTAVTLLVRERTVPHRVLHVCGIPFETATAAATVEGAS